MLVSISRGWIVIWWVVSVGGLGDQWDYNVSSYELELEPWLRIMFEYFDVCLKCIVQVTAPWRVGVSRRTDIWRGRESSTCVRSSPGVRWRMTGGFLARPGERNWLIGSTLLWGKLIHLSRRKDPFKLLNFALIFRMKCNFYNWIQFHIEDRKKLQMKSKNKEIKTHCTY